MNTYQIIFLCFVSALFVVYLIDRFTGRKILLTVVQWNPVLTTLTALVNAVAAVLPSSQFAKAILVLKAASDAAQKAEQLYLMGQLPKDERNEYAQLLIAQSLEQAGVSVTEQIQEIIDGCIAVACMLMPHGKTPSIAEGELTEE